MAENMDFKRILMISNYSMFEHSPLGITLRNIFKEWPDSNIFELYRYQTETMNNSKNDVSSYRIPSNFLPIDNLIRKISGKKVKYTNTESTFQISENIGSLTKLNLKSFVKYISESIYFHIKGSEIDMKINDFQPQVIYTIGESLFALKASLYYSKKYNIPIVVHYMDNWRETLYPPDRGGKFLNRLFLNNIEKVESKMLNGLVISPKMKKYYTSINPDVNFNVLLNSVKNSKNNVERDNKESEVIFTYIGGLHLNRWRSLLDIEKSIRELNVKGIRACLHVYTPKQDEKQFSRKFNKDFTFFKGYLPNEEVFKAYKEASVLIHVESFDDIVIRYTKYSLSTKIPECMSTGKPIICYAPCDLAVSEYINTTKSGIAACNYNDLHNGMQELAYNKQMRNELGRNGIITVRDKHTHNKANEVLLNTL